MTKQRHFFKWNVDPVEKTALFFLVALVGKTIGPAKKKPREATSYLYESVLNSLSCVISIYSNDICNQNLYDSIYCYWCYYYRYKK